MLIFQREEKCWDNIQVMVNIEQFFHHLTHVSPLEALSILNEYPQSVQCVRKSEGKIIFRRKKVFNDS